MSNVVHLLSAGAAQGLVRALRPAFEAEHACRLDGRFGAVGAMRQLLLDGTPCDVLILTAAQLDELQAQGRVRADARVALGHVATGVAVTTGAPRPDVSSPAALRAALAQARALYLPDPEKATAGIHVMKVLRELGLADELRERLRAHPNGATAMAEMARLAEAGALGCTQVTEILYTPGVQLVGVLPAPHGLRTLYGAAITCDAAQPELALDLLQRLGSPGHADLRHQGGFED